MEALREAYMNIMPLVLQERELGMNITPMVLHELDRDLKTQKSLRHQPADLLTPTTLAYGMNG